MPFVLLNFAGALERRQADLDSGTLRLDPGETKNDESRVVYLTPELKTLLVAQRERVERLSKQTRQIIPCLFPHLTGRRAGIQLSHCEPGGPPGRR